MSSNNRCSGLSRQRGYSTSRMASAFSRSKPFENVWDALGRQVAGRNHPPTNKNTLIRALTEEWDKLPQQLLDNVVQTLALSTIQVSVLFCSVPLQFGGRKPCRCQGPPTSLPPTARGFAARRLFRVPPCPKGTVLLQTSMSSPGFEPVPTASQSASLTTIPVGRRNNCGHNKIKLHSYRNLE
ncbi:hypothetical protein TNCV_3478481 [Trichonephila clavipes]|nr:hypothetical protein TNCV_3478481 [Trichonephila clavipes]